ncbi:MAG: HAMP domain-containing sensor histidine kinase [Pseudomonadota bacterium]
MLDANTASQEAERRFEQLIYHISHDLRASVRALKELPVWIEEDLEDSDLALPDSVREYMSLMGRHSERLDQFLIDLLTYSRVGRLQSFETVDLSRALDSALAKVTLPSEFELSRSFDQPTVFAGTQDIETLFVALLSNSIKHRSEESGRISVKSALHGGTMVIDFTDDGPGIAPEHRAVALKFMTTLKPRDEVEGSGLGLPIVQRICRFYGGSVTIGDGPDGMGCNIRILLPT